jgi:hypothetical protein
MRDQAPTSAGTVVTVTGAVIGEEEGVAVVVELLDEAPQAVAAKASTPTSNASAGLFKAATSSSLISRFPL